MLSDTPLTSRFQACFSPDLVQAGSFQDDNDIILFLHIPKTAGMSVGKALQSGFDIFHPVSWENTARSFRQKTKLALHTRTGPRPQRQVLMGHFAWSDLMFWKNHDLPLKCATIIRDPLDRFLSNYNYNCSPRHPQNEEFRHRFPTLEDYAQHLPPDYQLSLMLGAFYSFDHALERLCTYYSFIGVTEHLGASLGHFRRSHGLKDHLSVHRENTGVQSADDGPKVSDGLLNQISEKSRNDLRLHQMLLKSYS